MKGKEENDKTSGCWYSSRSRRGRKEGQVLISLLVAAGREGLLTAMTRLLFSSFSVTLLSSTPSSSHPSTPPQTHTPKPLSVEISSQRSLPMSLGTGGFMGHPSLRTPHPLTWIKDRVAWAAGWMAFDSVPLPIMEERWLTTGLNRTRSHTWLLNAQYNLVLLLGKKRESTGEKWKAK